MNSPEYMKRLRTSCYGATARLEALGDLLAKDEDRGGLAMLLRDISERLLRAVEDEEPGLDPAEEARRVY